MLIILYGAKLAQIFKSVSVSYQSSLVLSNTLLSLLYTNTRTALITSAAANPLVMEQTLTLTLHLRSQGY